MAWRVLIVDDEFGLADVTAHLLTDRGHHVAIALNGKLGLASLAAHPADLVLVDLMMPVMDGREMVRCMRADPALAAIPVILMTARPDAIPDRVDPLFAAILLKPFSLGMLLETVDRALMTRG
jgi:CheY-like chemotaxis protein